MITFRYSDLRTALEKKPKNITLAALCKHAATAANLRGHRLHWSVRHSESRTVALGVCMRCAAQVTCNTRPQPNDIAIGGDAVALHCQETRP